MPFGYGEGFPVYQPPIFYAYSHPALKYTGVTPLYALASEPSPFAAGYQPAYRGVTDVRSEKTD